MKSHHTIYLVLYVISKHALFNLHKFNHSAFVISKHALFTCTIQFKYLDYLLTICLALSHTPSTLLVNGFIYADMQKKILFWSQVRLCEKRISILLCFIYFINVTIFLASFFDLCTQVLQWTANNMQTEKE